MTRKRGQVRWVALTLALAGGAEGFAQTRPATTKAAPPPAAHSDAALVHELLRLKQVDAIKAEAAAVDGAAPDKQALWKAALIVAQWDDAAKEKADLTRAYLEEIAVCLKMPAAQMDGGWALDQAQFVLSKLSQPIVTRMEYWATSDKDRALLSPLASLATDLLKRAAANLDATMHLYETKQPFDERAYGRAYSAAAEVRYYSAWAEYFSAMAINPAEPDASAPAIARRKLLTEADAALDEWAVDADNGVNFQAYLLRGKVSSEARDFSKAIADFTKAQADKAPAWVQYQGRYQTVVANVRSRDFKAAQSSLDALKRSIPKDNAEARLSADMLGYRVAWAMAETRPTGEERKNAQVQALSILEAVVEKDARFRELVYEQLAAQIPENADVKALLPLQQLAVAFRNSQGQKGDTAESKVQLQAAVEAALLARGNVLATREERIEAAYLAGACDSVLGNLPDAVKYGVEFAEGAPNDPRAKQMVGVALEQIGELRKNAASAPGGSTAATGPATTAAKLPPELQNLAARALKLATENYGETQWRYAQARLLEDDGKPDAAAAVYEKIPADDRNYLDARYRLVTLATENFSALSKSPDEVLQAAAAKVFIACSGFVDLLDHPPESAPQDVLERAQTYRYDIWIIEAATALNPAVKKSDVAIDRLTKLDAAKAHLTEAQKSAVMRYRIQAYQMAGQADKALEVVKEYAVANNQDAMAVIRSMAMSTVEEINQTEATNPAHAKELALYLVKLLDPIIKQSLDEGKKDMAYEYQLIQADMMVRGGQYDEAQKLAVALQAGGGADGKKDIRANITEARAMFAQAKALGDKEEFGKAQDYFGRIVDQLSPGSESFWEAWLKIVQSMEGRGIPNGPDEIKSALTDLKGIYGSDYGGAANKAEFDRLWAKYGGN